MRNERFGETLVRGFGILAERLAGVLGWRMGGPWVPGPVRFGLAGLGWRVPRGMCCWLGWLDWDEPESLILAQSERWRHA